MTDDEFDKFLEAALRQRARAVKGEDEAAQRVLKRLAGPLPRQHRAVGQVFGALLDWQFAPAWPRMAALAASLAVGFAIGLSGIDRTIHRGAGSPDAGALVFEPQSLTGDRP